MQENTSSSMFTKSVLFLFLVFLTFSAQSVCAQNNSVAAKKTVDFIKNPKDSKPKDAFGFKVDDSSPKTLRFIFNKPVVQALEGEFPLALNASEAGSPLAVEKYIEESVAKSGFSIIPNIKGQLTWENSQTFSFVSDEFVEGKAYTFKFNSELTKLYGKFEALGFFNKDKSYASKASRFDTETKTIKVVYQPLVLLESKQIRYEQGSNVIWLVEFNHEVADAELIKNLQINSKGKTNIKIPFEIVQKNAKKVYLKFKSEPNAELVFFFNATMQSQAKAIPLVNNYEFEVKISSLFEHPYFDTDTDYQYPWHKYVVVNIEQNPNLTGIKEFIKIEPNLDFKIEPHYNDRFKIVANFLEKVPYKISLLKGLAGQIGVLSEQVDEVVQFSRQSERISFMAKGRYLSPDLPMLIKLSSINIEKVRLKAWRVYENNIPALVNLHYDGNDSYNIANFAKKITESTSTIPQSAKLEEHAIDLKQIVGMKPGTYFLEAEALVKDSDASSARSSQLVVVSDLGLAYKRTAGELLVWVNSIAKAKAVAGVEIKVYSKANQIIAQGVSDASGILKIKINEDLASNYVITAKKDDDISYIGTSEDLTEESSLAAGGRSFLGKGYEALCYTPRGIYKPGEKVTVKAIIRNAKMLPPESVFPVLWELKGPNGRSVGRGTANMSGEGGIDFSQELSFGARTGQYYISVFLPGEEKDPIGTLNFQVEDFVPPRLDFKLKYTQAKYTGTEPVQFDAAIKYLFGASGANLNYEAALRLDMVDFSHPKWEGYSFANDGISFDPVLDKNFASGQLDAEGKVQLKYQPNYTSEMPQALRLSVNLKVMEDGGRWNGKSLSVPLFSKPVLLGLYLADAQANTKFKINAIAINPEGEAAATTDLKAELFQVKNYYYSSRNSDGYTRPGDSEELVPFASFDLKLNKGQGTSDTKLGSAGTYLLKLKDPVTGASVAKRFEVYANSERDNSNSNTPLNKVSLSFDKPRYKIGDTAKVKITAPFAGRLIFSVSNNKELFYSSLDMSSPETELSVEITEAFSPDAFCTAWVARPVEAGKEWSAHRALGLGRINLDYSDSVINISAELPERLSPASQQDIAIKLTDAHGKPVKGELSLALVDEGVLSLTRHKNADPFGFFTAIRKFHSSVYDIYNLLMQLESSSLPLLKAGGDEGDDSGLFSPFKRKQEVLSLFLPTLVSDANGEIKTTLNIPEYSGSARLMLVAYAGNKFGNFSKTVPISRDVTAELTVPLALAPADLFDIPVRVFVSANALEAVGKTTLSLSSEGPVQLLGETSQELSLERGGSAELVFKAVATPKDSSAEMVGVAKIKALTKSADGKEFSQVVELIVRPPFPKITKSESGIIKKGTSPLAFKENNFLKGTQAQSLTIAPSPAVDIMKAVRYLSEYPYGCLEQTTSTAWPFMVVPDMLSAINSGVDLSDKGKLGLEKAFARLATMQNTDGSFNYWSGNSSGVYQWGSIYATHFLSEAAKLNSVTVPEELKKSALAWVKEFLSSSPSGNSSYYLSSKAYACYVLARNGDAPLGWMQYLNSNQDKLHESGKIFLAGAYALYAGTAAPMRELHLEKSVAESDAYDSTIESSVRNKALMLMVWNAVEPSSKEAAALALELSKSGKENKWYTTQENAMALFALGTYMRATSTGKSFQLKIVDPKGNEILRADEKQVVSAEPALFAKAVNTKYSAELTGEGTAYYSFNASGVPLTAPEPVSNDIVLKRTWVLADGTSHNLTNTAINQEAKTTNPAKKVKTNPAVNSGELQNSLSVKHGERVIVQLQLSSKLDENLKDLVLVDLLPGGFELENAKLLEADANISGTESNDAANDSEDDAGHNTAVGIRVEQREDRIVIIDPLVRRSKTYTYAMRAVHKGTFVVPPTVAECMYSPQTNVILASGKVIVEAVTEKKASGTDNKASGTESKALDTDSKASGAEKNPEKITEKSPEKIKEQPKPDALKDAGKKAELKTK